MAARFNEDWRNRTLELLHKQLDFTEHSSDDAKEVGCQKQIPELGS
jgi:hypothetical protein